MLEKLEVRFNRLEQAATEYGGFIATAVMFDDEDNSRRVQLPLDEFIKLFQHCRPRILYVFPDRFKSQESLLTYLQLREDEAAAVLARPEVSALVEHSANHNGELGSFLASFIFDGVLHTVFEQTEWLDEFESSADELESILADERDRDDEQRMREAAAKLHDDAKTLCSHPKFNDGRPSREKRIYLARSLFPDQAGREILALVDEATNMDWLNT